MTDESKAILAVLRNHVERGACTLTPADVDVLEEMAREHAALSHRYEEQQKREALGPPRGDSAEPTEEEIAKAWAHVKVAPPPSAESKEEPRCRRCGKELASFTAAFCADCESILEAKANPQPAPAPSLLREYLWCPKCQTQHVDRGEWATKPHHKHLCEKCGHVWDAGHIGVGVEPVPSADTCPECGGGGRVRGSGPAQYQWEPCPRGCKPKCDECGGTGFCSPSRGGMNPYPCSRGCKAVK